MNTNKQFSIPFVGLKTGKHQFEYKIDNTFFTEFDYSPVKQGDLTVDLEFNKQETMFVLEFVIKGTVKLTCDRCNEEFDFPVYTTEQIIFKTGDESYENADDIVVIAKNEHEINVSAAIYEFIVLAIPIIHIHPDQENGEPGCDKETIEALKKLSINTEKEESSPEVVHDPRWDALKKLRDN